MRRRRRRLGRGAAHRRGGRPARRGRAGGRNRGRTGAASRTPASPLRPLRSLQAAARQRAGPGAGRRAPPPGRPSACLPGSQAAGAGRGGCGAGDRSAPGIRLLPGGGAGGRERPGPGRRPAPLEPRVLPPWGPRASRPGFAGKDGGREAREEGSEPENRASASAAGLSLLLSLEPVRGSRCAWGACVFRTAAGTKRREGRALFPGSRCAVEGARKARAQLSPSCRLSGGLASCPGCWERNVQDALGLGNPQPVHVVGLQKASAEWN